MERHLDLTHVLSDFARTLGTDFSLEQILDQLVELVAAVLPVTGAGVMLMEPDDGLHFIASSNETIREIEALQRKYEEGPCLDAYRFGSAVAVPDLQADQRYPRFSDSAVDAGLAAVFTFPLRLDDTRLGALDLYRDTIGDLDAAEKEAAQVLADVAAAYLFNARARQAAAEHLAELSHLNLHDALTGLPNRILFTELVAHAIARAARTQHPTFAVLYLDLDRFKSVNDRYGHHAGDLLLRAVATRLSDALRPGDTLARLAGDEFAILCEDLSGPSAAELVAQRIRSALEQPVDLQGRPIRMKASVGIACSDGTAESAESLLHDADFAMYQAKRAGGATHSLADRAARVLVDRRARLEDELLPAITLGAVTLAYQPICQSLTGTLLGVEALARWKHPTLGSVSPMVFITLAERTGQIHTLGRWALRRACEDFMRWAHLAPDAVGHVAVNVSPRQVLAPTFSVTVAEILDQYGMDPRHLHLEVTESVFFDDAPRARAALEALKDLGVHLSLDDFGTGYSSLTYLNEFTFDSLKIDRSFTAAVLDRQSRSAAIVDSVTHLSRALDLTVVAEGVESAQQLDAVAELGCELAQGYHLSPPLTTPDFENLVLTSPRPTRLPSA